jgi:hypothetical protein
MRLLVHKHEWAAGPLQLGIDEESIPQEQKTAGPHTCGFCVIEKEKPPQARGGSTLPAFGQAVARFGSELQSQTKTK